MGVETRELRFSASESAGEVGALVVRPADARCLLALAHGAGAGMRHRFLEAAAGKLAGRGVATFRYQFPYAERGGRRPDPPRVLVATVRAALDAARAEAGGLPLFAGGKSLGGRMTSTALAGSPRDDVRGVVFLGFPLHAPGKPSAERAEHLARVARPLLFLQGTRDALADLAPLRPVCDALGERATLHVIEGADHSFHVPKRSGRSDDEVLDELAATVADWTAKRS